MKELTPYWTLSSAKAKILSYSQPQRHMTAALDVVFEVN